MKRPFAIISVYFILLLLPQVLCAQEIPIHHDLKVTLSPTEHRLTVADTVTLPKDYPGEILFSLHRGLKPSSSTPAIRIVMQGEKQGPVPLTSYQVLLPPDLRSFAISYEGVINHPVEKSGTEQARGFSDSPGVISLEGACLSGASGWYPDFGSPFVTFDLDVQLPPLWDAVSQGERILHDRRANMTLVRWKSPEPQDSIFLIAAPLTPYIKNEAGPVTAMAFLRSPDQALADKYLDATIRYIEMYSRLIGPYPYKKFALVENFWETGFGMPSFTLLGTKVIRLPFIINTSYPHEILHNWWGNSVYPVYKKGNWSEGLTAYLADYLMKEEQGRGAEYRIATLQGYSDYVIGDRDFPLTQFRSRHSASTEAVGYGKSLMFFHMLRLELGDDVFIKGLQEFFRKYKFHFATFDDIRTTFETVSSKDLRHEFEQWVTRTGAPQIKVSKPAVAEETKGFTLTALLEQTQAGDAYRMRIPLAVTLEGREQAFQTSVEMTTKHMELNLSLPARPLRLDVDPEFDLFHRLSRDATPPAITQSLGAKKMLIILPSKAGENLLRAYRELSQALAQSGPDKVEVKLDSQVSTLPSDRAITLLGWENRFVPEILSALAVYDVAVKEQAVRINQAEILRKNHAFVLTARLPQNHDMALSLIAADLREALPGLGRKLPHYQKYSYLAFEGVEPENVAKGRWPVIDSPLTVLVPDRNGMAKIVEMGRLSPRKPLLSHDPLFSQK